MLAASCGGSLPTLDPAVAAADDPAAYREVAKGAAYRQKAMPDLPSAARRAATPAARGLPPPRDFREVGRRALSVPPQHDGRAGARHPRRRASGALLRGLQPAHEALDGPGARRSGSRAATRSSTSRGSRRSPPTPPSRSPRSCLPGLDCLRGARLSIRRSPRSPRRSSRRGISFDSSPPEQVGRANEAISNGWREAVPALRALALEADDGALTFEVNLDQSAGETSTPKKVLEALLSRFRRKPRRLCPSRARRRSSADALPRHRHRPLRGGAQPDRLRARAPSLSTATPTRSRRRWRRKSFSSTTSRRLRRRRRRRSRRSRRSSTTPTSTTTPSSPAATRPPRTSRGGLRRGSTPPGCSAGPASRR